MLRTSDKVSDGDLKTLAQYIMLAKLSGTDISDKSYEDIIDNFKSLQEKNQNQNDKSVLEKEAKRQRLAPFLEVTLQDKTFSKKAEKEVFTFTVILKNTGQQKINTAAGQMEINDIMGKSIKNLDIFMDDEILPDHSLTQIVTIAYNAADDNDRRLRSKDLIDIRMLWDPERIIFSNGRLAE